jgi:hypothetical protein
MTAKAVASSHAVAAGSVRDTMLRGMTVTLGARRTLGRTALSGIVAAITAAGIIGTQADAATTSKATGPLPQASQGRCPKPTPQALPGDAIVGATRAALAQAHLVYKGTNLKGMRATTAALARFSDPGRGAYARVTCGRRIENRTVVVGLEFPAMLPSASLSQGVVLVSRFAGRYRVWAVLH